MTGVTTGFVEVYMTTDSRGDHLEMEFHPTTDGWIEDLPMSQDKAESNWRTKVITELHDTRGWRNALYNPHGENTTENIGGMLIDVETGDVITTTSLITTVYEL